MTALKRRLEDLGYHVDEFDGAVAQDDVFRADALPHVRGDFFPQLHGVGVRVEPDELGVFLDGFQWLWVRVPES